MDSDWYTLTIEHQGESASACITGETLKDEAVVGRFVTARLVPRLETDGVLRRIIREEIKADRDARSREAGEVAAQAFEAMDWLDDDRKAEYAKAMRAQA